MQFILDLKKSRYSCIVKINAMNRYDSDYGIIISQTTNTIKMDEDIIYIPMKTFSFI